MAPSGRVSCAAGRHLTESAVGVVLVRLDLAEVAVPDRRLVRRRRLVAALGLLALLIAACSGGEVVDFGPGQPDENQPALPADSGLDVADAQAPDVVPPPDARLVPGGWPEAAAFVAREAEQDRPTLVNIFASWCVPCRAEMPLLLEARDANPDITFLGIDHQDPLSEGDAFVEEMDIDFATLHDPEGDVAFAVGGRAMPTTVIFDADGKLAARVIGELTEMSLQNLLDAVR